MERMKHTGDYELDRINMLEQECADLEEENKKLKSYVQRYEKEEARLREENKKLKEERDEYKERWERSFSA